jgi:hypothetical protein
MVLGGCRWGRCFFLLLVCFFLSQQSSLDRFRIEGSDGGGSEEASELARRRGRRGGDGEISA